jgi:hypothetical protein
MIIEIKQIKQSIAKTCLLLFYSSCLLVLCIYLYPWKFSGGSIQDLFIFLPQWLWLLLPIFAIFIDRKLCQSHLIYIASFVVFNLLFQQNFNIPNNTFEGNSDRSLRVLSANLGGAALGTNQLKNQIDYRKPNIIVLQETDKSKIISAIPGGWYTHCVDHMCIASEYNLQYQQKLSRREFNLWGSYGVQYLAEIDGRLVNIINVHMETPRKGFESLISSYNFTGLNKNSEQRYQEAINLLRLNRDDIPTLYIGDFNMPWQSRIYQKYFNDLSNAFSEAGWGLGYTKYTSYHGIRIDHILGNHFFKFNESWVAGDLGGDHRPIFAEIIWR